MLMTYCVGLIVYTRAYATTLRLVESFFPLAHSLVEGIFCSSVTMWESCVLHPKMLNRSFALSFFFLTFHCNHLFENIEVGKLFSCAGRR